MNMEPLTRPVVLPVILGTARQGRLSEPIARFVVEQVSRRPEVETELIDIRNIRLPVDDAGEAIKDPKFSTTVSSADGLILVVPEYNHSFPGLLKHVLDSNLIGPTYARRLKMFVDELVWMARVLRCGRENLPPA